MRRSLRNTILFLLFFSSACFVSCQSHPLSESSETELHEAEVVVQVDQAPTVSDTTEEPAVQNTSKVINLTYERQSNSYQSNSNQSNTNRSGSSSNRSDSSKISSGNNSDTTKKQEDTSQKEYSQTAESVPLNDEASTTKQPDDVSGFSDELAIIPANEQGEAFRVSLDRQSSPEEEQERNHYVKVIIVLSIIVVLLYAVVIIRARHITVEPIKINLRALDNSFINNLLSKEERLLENDPDSGLSNNDGSEEKTVTSESEEEIK